MCFLNCIQNVHLAFHSHWFLFCLSGPLKPPMCLHLPKLMGILSKEHYVALAKEQHTCGLVLSELGQETGEPAFVPIIASHSGIPS